MENIIQLWFMVFITITIVTGDYKPLSVYDKPYLYHKQCINHITRSIN